MHPFGMASCPPGPVSAGGSVRVIQGFFPSGRPTIIQPAAPTPMAPRLSPTLSLPARIVPGAVSPPIRPGAVGPEVLQPSRLAPVCPTAPRPILPRTSRPVAVQPSGGNSFALPPGFHLRPSRFGQRLPELVQRKMEAFFGADFSQVRVHVGPEAASIGAMAFTHGTDLYFAPGQYNPTTPHGQRLLGHELTHVVQQRAGRVRSPLGSGIAVVVEPGLEAEAERMGQHAAMARASLNPAGPTHGGLETVGPMLQSARSAVGQPARRLGPSTAALSPAGNPAQPAARQPLAAPSPCFQSSTIQPLWWTFFGGAWHPDDGATAGPPVGAPLNPVNGQRFDDAPVVVVVAPVVAGPPNWPLENAQIVRGRGNREGADLDVLIERVRGGTGNLYRRNIGTVVGGRAIRNGVRVEGLNDQSSRIDVQNPPGQGQHNVQFQVGGNSYAGVLFEDEDPLDDVLHNLRRAFDNARQARSPNS